MCNYSFVNHPLDICLRRTPGHTELRRDLRQSPAWGTQPPGPHGSFTSPDNHPPACPGGTSQPSHVFTRGSFFPEEITKPAQCSALSLIHSDPSVREFAATPVSFHIQLHECAVAFSQHVGCIPIYLTLQYMFKPYTVRRN